ncbi:serine hydrolase [Actinokineospora sp. UTMC 2448]|uniref:serine hydrolase n=1 Tax=Actinokineospora sp. UTMC 2448 TaxID=2268449 RepID=UPI0021641C45|nr:serine hydrolase [Actinokineospora sp. UTMC 2448]UVS78841.1 beta-lactamase TEM [Actinokineospora sp. UTMC 2448]
MRLTRRTALGLGTTTATTALLGTVTARAQAAPSAPAPTPSPAASTDDGPSDAPPTTRAEAHHVIAYRYAWETHRAGGVWSSVVSMADADGRFADVVADDADRVVEAYSVNKIAVAVAVLDKVDRGLLRLDQRVDVTADIVIQDTDGIFGLDGAYPSSVTLGHAMAALLTVSDNTAVRLCGLVCPARELNDILRAKGFTHTQVVPVTNPNRFFLGTTTPRETTTLLHRLAAGELLTESSTRYLLNALRSLTSFTDGIRLRLTSPERLRVATKAGWFNDGRNEAGLIFTPEGAPVLSYALFASGPFTGDAATNNADFGATHPALRARAGLGRTLMDATIHNGTTTAHPHRAKYSPRNGN